MDVGSRDVSFDARKAPKEFRTECPCCVGEAITRCFVRSRNLALVTLAGHPATF